MTDTITIRGHIGTDIASGALPSGDAVCNFRVASTERRLNDKGEWQDVHTNWYTVACFRKLAQNVQTSLSKGDRVIIHGRLRYKSWQKHDGGTGFSLEVSADSVGPDLGWGTANFKRNVTRSELSGDNTDNAEGSENSGSPESAGVGAQEGESGYVTHPETGETVNPVNGEVAPVLTVATAPEGFRTDEMRGEDAFGRAAALDDDDDDDDDDEDDATESDDTDSSDTDSEGDDTEGENLGEPKPYLRSA